MTVKGVSSICIFYVNYCDLIFFLCICAHVCMYSGTHVPGHVEVQGAHAGVIASLASTACSRLARLWRSRLISPSACWNCRAIPLHLASYMLSNSRGSKSTHQACIFSIFTCWAVSLAHIYIFYSNYYKSWYHFKFERLGACSCCSWNRSTK